MTHIKQVERFLALLAISEKRQKPFIFPNRLSKLTRLCEDLPFKALIPNHTGA